MTDSAAPTTATRKPRSVTIRLPLPSRELSPNGRFHWRSSARAKKFARLTAKYATEAQAGFARAGGEMAKATCEARFYFKQDRRRDRDNLLASLKAYFDGVADAGLVRNDSDMTYLPVVVAIDRTNPRVELHITETE